MRVREFAAGPLNLPVILRSTMVLLPRFNVQETLKLIQHYRPTLFMGVPAMYGKILQNPNIGRYDLSSIRFCISGADSLPLETQTRFEAVTHCKLVEGYGEGELQVRGPRVMEAYCENPEETNKILKEGWLRTGDIARMDKNGYIEFLGLTKDLIKVQKTGYMTSYKVYPNEIETVLLSHDKVLDAAVIGVPDPQQGERVKAFVVLKPNMHISAEELINFSRRNLAEYKVPSEIEFSARLPKNILGKVLKKELRQ